MWLLLFFSYAFANAPSHEIYTSPESGQVVSFQVGGELPDSSLNLTEIVWIGPESAGLYLGSPSIASVTGVAGQSEYLVASHDYFGVSTLNATVQVFTSTDGNDWKYANNVSGMYWAELFQYGGAGGDMYLLGVSGGDSDKNRSIVISRSIQGGPWSAPTVLFPANNTHNYHCAPSPLLHVEGKIYRAFETENPTYAAMLVWTKEGADLMSPSSWSFSSILSFNKSWIPPSWDGSFGFQEGNAVQAPNGDIVDILRLDGQTTKVNNMAVVTRLNPDNYQLEFQSFIKFPACSSKFEIRRSPTDKRYYTLSTNVTDQNIALGLVYARNNLVLAVSDDLYNWRICSTLLRDDTGFDPTDSARFTGFHYVGWDFLLNDIIYAVRTGYRGANSYHNANRMTYKRISDYKSLCP